MMDSQGSEALSKAIHAVLKSSLGEDVTFVVVAAESVIGAGDGGQAIHVLSNAASQPMAAMMCELGAVQLLARPAEFKHSTLKGGH